MYLMWIVILICFLFNKVSDTRYRIERLQNLYRQDCSKNFTQTSVIETPGFPDPYPANSTCNWTWSRPSGKWAVSFEVFDINCRDTLYLKDVTADKLLPFDCSHRNNIVPVYYTKGSHLILKFRMKGINRRKQGFRIRIIYGKDIDELKKQVYNQKTGNSVQNAEMNNYFPWLLPTILVILIIIGVGFVVNLRRSSTRHTVPVDVSVNNKPYNLVVFEHTPSTVKVEASHGSVNRSTNVMSWTMRATLSSTSSGNNGGVVDNLYMPMSNDIVNYQNQINKPLPAVRQFVPLAKPISNMNRYPVNNISRDEHPVNNVYK